MYVSVDLLVSLSLKVGDVAWLSGIPGASVPVIVSRGQQANADNGSLCCESISHACCLDWMLILTNSDSYWLESQHEELPEASVVTVRPIGRPVPQSQER